jgi:hypothetical protein
MEFLAWVGICGLILGLADLLAYRYGRYYSSRLLYWLHRYRSWRYLGHAKGFQVKRVSGKAPSLGKLRATKSRFESLNGKGW